MRARERARLERQPQRVRCGCGCGVWWYTPPADPRRRYVNKQHQGFARRILPEQAECAWCRVPFTNLSRLGRPRQYCSMACRDAERHYRARRARFIAKRKGGA